MRRSAIKSRGGIERPDRPVDEGAAAHIFQALLALALQAGAAIAAFAAAAWLT
jgi:hypothetical protein